MASILIMLSFLSIISHGPLISPAITNHTAHRLDSQVDSVFNHTVIATGASHQTSTYTSVSDGTIVLGESFSTSSSSSGIFPAQGTGSYTLTSEYIYGTTTSTTYQRNYFSAETVTTAQQAYTGTTSLIDSSTVPTTTVTFLTATSVIKTLMTSTQLTSMIATNAYSTVPGSHTIHYGSVYICYPGEIGYVLRDGFGDVANLGTSFTRTTVEATNTSWRTWTTGGEGSVNDAQMTIPSSQVSSPASSTTTSTSAFTWTGKKTGWDERKLPHETTTFSSTLPITTLRTYSSSTSLAASSTARATREATVLRSSWANGRMQVVPSVVSALTTSSTSATSTYSTTVSSTNDVPTTWYSEYPVSNGFSTHSKEATSYVTVASRITKGYRLSQVSGTILTAKSTSPSSGYFLPSQMTTYPQTSSAGGLGAVPEVNWYRFWSAGPNARVPVSYPTTIATTFASAGSTTSVTALITSDTLSATTAQTTTTESGASTTISSTVSAQLSPIANLSSYLFTGADTVVAGSIKAYGLAPGVYRSANGTSLSPTFAMPTATTTAADNASRTYFEIIKAFDVATVEDMNHPVFVVSVLTNMPPAPFIPSSIL